MMNITFDFELVSFLIGTAVGSGAVWSYLQYKINKRELLFKEATAGDGLHSRLSELLLSLAEMQGRYSDVRDGKINIGGIKNNYLITLKTEIDLVHDHAVATEKRLSEIENRQPRKIPKNHGGRPAPPGNPVFN